MSGVADPGADGVAALAPSAVARFFGRTLGEAVANSTRYANIPDLCADCMEHLVTASSKSDVDVIELFQDAQEDNKVVQALSAKFERGEDVSFTNVSDSSEVLLRFLTLLVDDPVLPHSHTQALIAVVAHPDNIRQDDQWKAQCLARLLPLLPPHHAALLCYLCQSLFVLASNVVTTSTHHDNHAQAEAIDTFAKALALVILRPSAAVHASAGANVTEADCVLLLSFLISQQSAIFGPERVLPKAKTAAHVLPAATLLPQQKSRANMKTMFGFLERLDGDKWRKKYCLAVREERVLKFYHAKDTQRKKVHLAIELSGCTVMPGAPQEYDYDVFVITPPAPAQKIVLKAPSREQYTRWVDCLISVISGPHSGIPTTLKREQRKKKKKSIFQPKAKATPRLPPNFSTFLMIKRDVDWVQFDKRYVLVATDERMLRVFNDEAQTELERDVPIFSASVVSSSFEEFNRPGVFSVQPAACNSKIVFCCENDTQKDIFVATLKDLSKRRRRYSLVNPASLFEGQLHVQKKGVLGVLKWDDDQWSVLVPTESGRGGTLQLFRSKKSKKSTTSIEIAVGLALPPARETNPNHVKEGDVDTKLPYPFSISSMQGKKVVERSLCASTALDRRDWIRAINGLAKGEVYSPGYGETKQTSKRQAAPKAASHESVTPQRRSEAGHSPKKKPAPKAQSGAQAALFASLAPPPNTSTPRSSASSVGEPSSHEHEGDTPSKEPRDTSRRPSPLAKLLPLPSVSQLPVPKPLAKLLPLSRSHTPRTSSSSRSSTSQHARKREPKSRIPGPIRKDTLPSPDKRGGSPQSPHRTVWNAPSSQRLSHSRSWASTSSPPHSFEPGFRGDGAELLPLDLSDDEDSTFEPPSPSSVSDTTSSPPHEAPVLPMSSSTPIMRHTARSTVQRTSPGHSGRALRAPSVVQIIPGQVARRPIPVPASSSAASLSSFRSSNLTRVPPVIDSKPSAPTKRPPTRPVSRSSSPALSTFTIDKKFSEFPTGDNGRGYAATRDGSDYSSSISPTAVSPNMPHRRTRPPAPSRRAPAMPAKTR